MAYTKSLDLNHLPINNYHVSKIDIVKSRFCRNSYKCLAKDIIIEIIFSLYVAEIS